MQPTRRSFLTYFRNRTFNVDAYLDEQLVQKVERPAPWPAPPDYTE
jgi:hypothetical protein